MDPLLRFSWGSLLDRRLVPAPYTKAWPYFSYIIDRFRLAADNILNYPLH